jgi:hypothetical protein
MYITIKSIRAVIMVLLIIITMIITTIIMGATWMSLGGMLPPKRRALVTR